MYQKRGRKRNCQHWWQRWHIDQRLGDYIEKREGLITAIRKDTDNTMDNRMTITRRQKWEEKQLYVHFKRLINHISHEKTRIWLRKANFKKEAESLRIVGQNNTRKTNYIKAIIDKTQQNGNSITIRWQRWYHQSHNKQMQQIAQKEYKTSHYWVDKVIHWEMCKKLKIWPYQQMVYAKSSICPRK